MSNILDNYNKDNKLLLPKGMLNNFMAKINIPKDKSKCWIWMASLNNGYGTFSTYGLTGKFVHRIMYELIKGRIKESYTIDHLCSNKLCVNPEHLEQVTRDENLLRGNGDLTHAGFCSKGHKRTLDNIYITPSTGATRCRKCKGIYHPERKDFVNNKDKTYCKRGHEFTKENTYLRSNGGRQCRTCMSLRNKGLI